MDDATTILSLITAPGRLSVQPSLCREGQAPLDAGACSKSFCHLGRSEHGAIERGSGLGGVRVNWYLRVRKRKNRYPEGIEVGLVFPWPKEIKVAGDSQRERDTSYSAKQIICMTQDYGRGLYDSNLRHTKTTLGMCYIYQGETGGIFTRLNRPDSRQAHIASYCAVNRGNLWAHLGRVKRSDRLANSTYVRRSGGTKFAGEVARCVRGLVPVRRN